MSNAGLRVISESGILQIDSSYRNLHLIGKQDVPHYNDGGANFSSGNYYYQPQSKTSILAYGMDSWYPDVMPRTDAEVSARDYNGAIAHSDRMSQPWCSFPGRMAYDASSLILQGKASFGMTTASSKLVDVVRESSGPRFVYQSVDYRDAMPPKNAGVNCSVYEFDLVNLAASASKVGMQVFDGNGDLVFDSSYKPMRVVKFFQGPIFWGGSQYQYPPNIWELPVSTDGVKRKYAIAPLDATYRFHNQYVGGYFDGNDYVTSSGSGSLDLFQWQESRILHYPQAVNQWVRDRPNEWLYTGMTTVNYLLLDVTGY